MRQRYINGEPFHSKWQNFEQMSFMREHMKSDIENIDRIREEIQLIVEEQKSRQTIDLCTDDEETYPIESENRAPNEDRESPCSNQSYRCKLPESVNATQSNHSSKSIQAALLPEIHLSKEKAANVDDNKEPAILTLDLISDEEENNDDSFDDMDIISLDNDMSLRTNASAENYEEVVVYFEDSINDDVICLDDDETENK